MTLRALEHRRLEAEQALLASQIRAGPLEGSWDSRDPWTPAGGRLYSTALAALVLKSDRA